MNKEEWRQYLYATCPFDFVASGFEIFARDSRGRYVDQMAMGEAAGLDESKALAEAMVRRPRSQWPALALV
jgi:hypothetical protein